MTRGLSDTERRLLARWNDENYKHARLTQIHISGKPGPRGIGEMRVLFASPVVGIAGTNGSGKSTLLACAACAYHNDSDFVPIGRERKAPYYTFKQFFQATSAEAQQKEIVVAWFYSGQDHPEMHVAIKLGRWSHYEKRPHRPVQFVGLSRALPAQERSVLRTHFVGKKPLAGPRFARDETSEINRIMGTQYREVGVARSKKYALHMAIADDFRVSAFNLGAGEDSVFLLYHLAHSLPQGTLLLIEELETALHPRAQTLLVKGLLDLSWKRHLQIIFTTHSKPVLEALPPEGRVFLRRDGATVEAMYGVTSDYAFSLMSESPIPEAAVYVEDSVARALLQEALPPALRRRCTIVHIGSWLAVVTQISAHLRNSRLGKWAAVFDGDVCPERVLDQLEKTVERKLENSEQELLRQSISYLPGPASPEKWLRSLFETNTPFLQQFAALTSLSELESHELQNAVCTSSADSLVHQISLTTALDEETALTRLAMAAVQTQREVFSPIVQVIQRCMSS